MSKPIYLLSLAFISSISASETRPPQAVESTSRPMEQLADTEVNAPLFLEGADLVPVGSIQLIELPSIRTAYQANLDNVLNLIPGVFAQSGEGGRQSRLSIRGSGLQNRFGGAGLQIRYNGLPLNRADGSFETQAIDPAAIEQVIAYPGGNAFHTGAAQLGGAIDFKSPTGHTREGNRLRVNGGSWQTYGASLESGYVSSEKTVDTYAILNAQWSDGFRKNSERRDLTLNTTIGWQHDERRETRLFLLASEGRLELPGGLTRAEAQADPRASLQPTIEWRRDIDDLLFGGQHSVENEDARFSFSAFAGRTEFDHPVNNPPFNFRFDDVYRNYGFQLSAERDYALGGMEHRLRLGLNFAYTESKRRGTQPVFTFPFPRADIRTDQRASQTVFSISQLTELSANTRLEYGTQLIDATRHQTNRVDPTQDFDERYRDWAPRIGLSHQLAPELEVYANYTLSYEAPRFGSIASGNNIRPQRARTIEVGTRGEAGAHRWQLGYYRSEIKDRFIFVTPPTLTVAQIENTDAHQQGIEISTQSDLNKIFSSPSDAWQVRWQNVFTWTENRFANDPVRGNNRLPIVPEFSYSSRLSFAFEERFSFEATLQGVFGSRPIDNANTAELPSYTLLHFGANYAFNERFHIYAELRNVLDRRYIATQALVDDATLVLGPNRSFSPGEPRALYLGASLGF